MNLFHVPQLTRPRVIAAYAVAVGADVLQWILGPAGWVFGDEIVDVAVMAAEAWLLGFHVLLLPTFALEFLPVADWLPTWTGCVALVVALRRREQRVAAQGPPGQGPVIDVQGKVE
jgi:hypothetical protein